MVLSPSHREHDRECIAVDMRPFARPLNLPGDHVDVSRETKEIEVSLVPVQRQFRMRKSRSQFLANWSGANLSVSKSHAMSSAFWSESQDEDEGVAKSRTATRELAADDAAKLRGLTDTEVTDRQRRFGKNVLGDTGPSLWKMIFQSYFNNFMQAILVFTIILSAISRGYAEVVVLAFLFVINGTTSFVHSRNSVKAIAELRNQYRAKAKVIRNGAELEIEPIELVPDDVVVLERGIVLQCDCRLETVLASVTMDESAITGESLPVDKEMGASCSAGTIVKSGFGRAIVTQTGKASSMGRIIQLSANARKRESFQRILNSVMYILVGLGVIVAIVVLPDLGVRDGFSSDDILELLAVILVAAIPVALPVVVTAVLTGGAKLLAKHHVIVSRLAALEALAEMDVLASDKTGTLTANQLEIQEIVSLGEFDDFTVKMFAFMACPKASDDPIDKAILRMADADKSIQNEVAQDFVLESMQPFDSARKRLMAFWKHEDSGRPLLVLKGAPQALCKALPVSSGSASSYSRDPVGKIQMPDQVQYQVDKAVKSLASRGLRPLGIACREDGTTWKYVGVIGIFDPPRHDSRATLLRAHELGIRVKMITGDHVLIAQETSRMLGIGGNVVALHGDESKAQIAEDADGFAEVLPEDKYRVIHQLQRNKHVVGMTGDGVNDVAALRRADCGIAVAGATDAARSAADIVLTQPGLSVVIDAIVAARKIFQNVRNYLIFRIAASITLVFWLFFSLLLFYDPGSSTSRFVTDPVSILIIAVLLDIANLANAYDHVRPSLLPSTWDLPEILVVAIVLGFLGVEEQVLIFTWARNSKFVFHSVAFNTNELHALIFFSLGASLLLTIFISRTRGMFFQRRPSFLVLTVNLSWLFVMTILGVYWPFSEGAGWKAVGITWGLILIAFVIKDVCKRLLYAYFDSANIRHPAVSAPRTRNWKNLPLHAFYFLRGPKEKDIKPIGDVELGSTLPTVPQVSDMPV
eukprot:ANDGO_06948.mRNA.1 putative plasma membrane ATPase